MARFKFKKSSPSKYCKKVFRDGLGSIRNKVMMLAVKELPVSFSIAFHVYVNYRKIFHGGSGSAENNI